MYILLILFIIYADDPVLEHAWQITFLVIIKESIMKSLLCIRYCWKHFTYIVYLILQNNLK